MGKVTGNWAGYADLAPAIAGQRVHIPSVLLKFISMNNL